MRILNWSWENLRSFGGTVNKIDLSKNGELVLVSGNNGSGKTTMFQALDIAAYGQTYNKDGKRLNKSTYPNWVNGGLFTGCEIKTDNNDVLKIKRTMKNTQAPLKLDLEINDRNKNQVGADKIIEDELGMDFQTFKSFCSINVSYFKDFISLSPSDKRMILDKLFNMEQINELNKILKQLKKENNNTNISIKGKIDTFEENIFELKASINGFITKQNENKIKQKEDNTKTIKVHKKEIIKLNETIKNLGEEEKEINEIIDLFEKGINKLKVKSTNYQRNISDVKEKIKLYELGICPTCKQDLKDKLELLPSLKEEESKNKKLYEKIKKKTQEANQELISYKNKLRKISQDNFSIKSDIRELQTIIKTLEKEDIIEDDDNSVEIFENNLKDMNNKLNKEKEKYKETEQLKHIYDILEPIWTDDGIKKRIISSIIDPINKFIADDLNAIDFPYTVELDDKFDAHIYNLMNEIDTDNLSSGESRKLNLVVMLAYIKMMRLKTELNLLILDEVFTTIDTKSIDEILYLLKDFAKEREISIFVVHHTELKEYMFDRIFKISKPYFSVIDEY